MQITTFLELVFLHQMCFFPDSCNIHIHLNEWEERGNSHLQVGLPPWDWMSEKQKYFSWIMFYQKYKYLSLFITLAINGFCQVY